jgi:hypothetical protein
LRLAVNKEMKSRKRLFWVASIGLLLTLAAIYADEGCYCLDNFRILDSLEFVVALVYWTIFSGLVALLIMVGEVLLKLSKKFVRSIGGKKVDLKK